MKKAIAIIVVLITTLFAACSPAEDPKMQACVGYLTIYSEDEYNDYLAKEADNLPSIFVKWEDIQMLGKFRGFGLSNYYYSYWYGFTDKFSNDLIIYINHDTANIKAEKKKLASLPKTVLPAGAQSMKIANCSQASVITQNGLYYYYIPKGELLNIEWFDENAAYCLSGVSRYRYTKNAATTFVGRLLSADDAVKDAAFAEIKQSLDAGK